MRNIVRHSLDSDIVYDLTIVLLYIVRFSVLFYRVSLSPKIKFAYYNL